MMERILPPLSARAWRARAWRMAQAVAGLGVAVAVVLADTSLADTSLAAEAGHERALEAVGRGEILPLERILASVQKHMQGRVLDVTLQDGAEGLYGWVYDVRIYAPGHRIVVLRVDAATASILAVRAPPP